MSITKPLVAVDPFKLPALKGLGKLADVRPTIIVDSREQSPLVFTRLASIRGTLYSADYSVLGLENLFGVERKTIPDLVGCCMGSERERLSRELLRLRGYSFRRLLVIGCEAEILAGQYHSKITPKAVLATLAAFEIRYDLPVVYSPSPAMAALKIESWAFWFCREVVQGANGLLRANAEGSQL